MTNLSQDTRSLGRDLNPEPLEYEARVVTTWQRRSVWGADNIESNVVSEHYDKTMVTTLY